MVGELCILFQQTFLGFAIWLLLCLGGDVRSSQDESAADALWALCAVSAHSENEKFPEMQGPVPCKCWVCTWVCLWGVP
jgi:hypothetical protein